MSSALPEPVAGGPRASVAASLAAARALFVALAFLLGLSTARNADVWAHLASGRLAIAGDIHLYPYSWLADAIQYAIFSAIGGTGLIVGKALVVAATAAVMLRPALSWRMAIAVLPAILALGAWLPLNPTCASYLFLAMIATAIFEPGATANAGWGGVLRRHWSLLIVLVVWANVDAWCWLGAATIGVVALTRSLGSAVRGEPVDLAPSRLFILAIIATCLSPLPWNAEAYMLGCERTADVFEAGSPFRKPIQSAILELRFNGLVPVFGFWLIAVISLLSFRAVPRGRVLERAIPWLGLFAASILSVQFAPFFVVLAGAAVIRNLREASAPAPAPVASTRPVSGLDRWQAVARIGVGTLAAVVLLGAAWSGWLQRAPAERRNWTLEPDPSLVAAAEQVEAWYAAGALADRRTAFAAADAADIAAWYAPRASAASRAYEPGVDGALDPHVGCVVLSDGSRVNFLRKLKALAEPQSPWVLTYLRGRAAIFTRQDSGLPPVDLPARAFGAKADRAPESAPPEAIAPPRWYDPFVLPRPPRSLDRDEAVTYQLYEGATNIAGVEMGVKRFLAAVAASMAASPQPIDPRLAILAAAGDAESVRAIYRFAGFSVLTGISADRYLSVRAARRGVAAAPRSADAYEVLGESYLRLLYDPLEASWGRMLPATRRLRLVQAAEAFHRATVLEPNLAGPHRGLASIYFEQGFLDLAADELRAFERLSGSNEMEQVLAQLTKDVAASRQSVEANSVNLSVLDRARLAARNGLAGQALNALLQSDVAAFGATGMAMELDLLLGVGRAAEAGEWLAEEHRATLGVSAYDWLRVQAAAGEGNYAAAATILAAQAAPPVEQAQDMTIEQMWEALKPFRKGLAEQPTYMEKGVVAIRSVAGGLASYGRQLSAERNTRTENLLLLALLALEQGNMPSCSRHLESISGVWKNIDERGDEYPSAARTIARQMACLLRR
jgi:hypothetical protein